MSSVKVRVFRDDDVAAVAALLDEVDMDGLFTGDEDRSYVTVQRCSWQHNAIEVHVDRRIGDDFSTKSVGVDYRLLPDGWTPEVAVLIVDELKRREFAPTSVFAMNSVTAFDPYGGWHE